MLTIIDQPGTGKTTYRFVHVSRAEPDASLFRVPDGLTIEDGPKAPPPPVTPSHGVSSSPQLAPGKPSLPYAIKDDNYLEALARFHAAVPRWLPSNVSYHCRTDVHIIDIYGNESSATVDHWQKGQLSRDEEQAPGFHYTVVWGPEQHWSTHEGIPPLRLMDLSDLTPRPGPAERRIRIFAQGYVAMKSKSIDGVLRRCSGRYAGAELCFDTGTGFPVSATVDNERVVYEQWDQYEGAIYPSRLALYRGRRLQMEATTTITLLGNSNDDLFHPLPRMVPSPNRLGAYREDQHQILAQGQMYTSSYGEALVRVSVDESGRVRRAELLDADDRSLGAAAVAAAKKNVYMPWEADGRREPFDAIFLATHWLTIDPLRVAATSRQSQGRD